MEVNRLPGLSILLNLHLQKKSMSNPFNDLENILKRIEQGQEELKRMLEGKPHKSGGAASDGRQRALNLKECAAFTGFSMSRLYQLTSKGLIPHFKRGNRLFFDRDEVEMWLLQNKQA